MNLKLKDGERAPSSHEWQPLNVIFAEHAVQALKAFKVSSTSAATPHKDGVKRRQVFETIEQRGRSETERNEMTRVMISLGNVSIDANLILQTGLFKTHQRLLTIAAAWTAASQAQPREQQSLIPCGCRLDSRSKCIPCQIDLK